MALKSMVRVCAGRDDHPGSPAQLDTTVWLRYGEQASKRLHCSQTTVSLKDAETTELFGLEWNRVDGEWQ